eukprot:1153639-Pelagomonas_calceolata.AAC.12
MVKKETKRSRPWQVWQLCHTVTPKAWAQASSSRTLHTPTRKHTRTHACIPVCIPAAPAPQQRAVWAAWVRKPAAAQGSRYAAAQSQHSPKATPAVAAAAAAVAVPMSPCAGKLSCHLLQPQAKGSQKFPYVRSSSHGGCGCECA